jgi:hypothetical protein
MTSVEDKVTAIAVILISSAILLIIVFYPFPSSEQGPYNPPIKIQNPPVNEEDYIMWSVNGTRNGVAVSGVSNWTFSHVSSYAEVYGLEGWPKYDIAIITSLNGMISSFTTAGAYKNKTLWALGLNPAVIGEGVDGYYNLYTPVFDRNENLTTVLGFKETTVFTERYNFNASDFWSQIWIDASSGMPYKIEVTEPMILNGFHNDQWGTLTFELMATSIGH